MADVGASDQPVYGFTRPVEPSSDPAARIHAALAAYLDGPTDEQKRLGYMTAVPTPFPGALGNVAIEGRDAIVSFAPALEERVGVLPSAAAQAFLLELQTTVFQFSEVDRLRLSVAGDCQRFWRLFESTCVILERGS